MTFLVWLRRRLSVFTIAADSGVLTFFCFCFCFDLVAASNILHSILVKFKLSCVINIRSPIVKYNLVLKKKEVCFQRLYISSAFFPISKATCIDFVTIAKVASFGEEADGDNRNE